MAYFSNGSEGEFFEAQWCSKCVHDGKEAGCPVMALHIIYNYQECNNKESFLGILISDEPKVCNMFHETK
jgi:hypothetical protein